MSDKVGVLFICLGNICRSPIAEAVFLDEIKKAGIEDKFTVDSAAIGSWHVGRNPDKRAQDTLKKHNITYEHKARQIKADDFKKYDYIFGMDNENIDDINSVGSSAKTQVDLLGKYDPKGQLIIRDPYYDSGSEGFEQCYVQCKRCIEAFIPQIKYNK